MGIEDDLLAKLRKLKLRDETWELGVRKARSWVERKKGKSTDDLEAAEQDGWSLPGPNTILWIVRAGGKRDFSRASLQDLLWLEGALAALNQYFAKDLHVETNDLPSEAERTYPIETLNGLAKAVLRAPVCARKTGKVPVEFKITSPFDDKDLNIPLVLRD
jgi:hypothetical protein